MAAVILLRSIYLLVKMIQKIMLIGHCLFYVEQMVQAEQAEAVEQVVIMVIMEHRAAVEPVAAAEPVASMETMVIMAHQAAVAPAAQVAATPV